MQTISICKGGVCPSHVICWDRIMFCSSSFAVITIFKIMIKIFNPFDSTIIQYMTLNVLYFALYTNKNVLL